MPKSDVDVDELVARGVRELFSQYKGGKRLNVAAKACELGVHKDCLSLVSLNK